MILGIDPGGSGALAYINLKGDWQQTYPLKNLTDKDLFDLINEESEKVEKAFLEKVNCTPIQGVKAVWSFSGSYHGLKMALIASEVSFEEVSPFVWQSKMKCLTKGDKNITKKKAQELFPRIKITHANADALLIAEYGRRYGIK